MQKTQTLLVSDPFRAAYLLLFGRYLETRFNEGKRLYVIAGEGQTLAQENYRYRTGYALVNPLSLKEALSLLKELSHQERSKKEAVELVEITRDDLDLLADEEEEIDLLTDEEEA
jgi:hypothetical protein